MYVEHLHSVSNSVAPKETGIDGFPSGYGSQARLSYTGAIALRLGNMRGLLKLLKIYCSSLAVAYFVLSSPCQ